MLTGPSRPPGSFHPGSRRERPDGRGGSRQSADPPRWSGSGSSRRARSRARPRSSRPYRRRSAAGRRERSRRRRRANRVPAAVRSRRRAAGRGRRRSRRSGRVPGWSSRGGRRSPRRRPLWEGRPRGAAPNPRSRPCRPRPRGAAPPRPASGRQSRGPARSARGPEGGSPSCAPAAGPLASRTSARYRLSTACWRSVCVARRASLSCPASRSARLRATIAASARSSARAQSQATSPKLTALISTIRALRDATAGRCLAHLQPCSHSGIGRALMGAPVRHRHRSSASSPAVAYRRDGSFSRHLRQIVSRSRAQPGLQLARRDRLRRSSPVPGCRAPRPRGTAAGP